MFAQKFPTGLLPQTGRTVLLTAALASIPAFLVWATNQNRSEVVKKDNFNRILEVVTDKKLPLCPSLPKKIEAKIDTGADYSLISKTVVDDLGLDTLPLTPEDSSFLLLPDSRELPVQGKFVLCFHVADTPLSHPVFRFGKYAYEAVFFVPKEVDICAFDAYIGADIINRYHVQGSYFFSSIPGASSARASHSGITPAQERPRIRTDEERRIDETRQQETWDRQVQLRAEERRRRREQLLGGSAAIEMSNRQTAAQNTSASSHVQAPSRGTVAEPTEEENSNSLADRK